LQALASPLAVGRHFLDVAKHFGVAELFAEFREKRIDLGEDKEHLAAASGAEKQVFVQQALADKRGGRFEHVCLNESMDASPQSGEDLVALDDALKALEEMDARKARVVELRFFTGLSVEQTAEALKISVPTVKRDWKLAKAWLTRELSRR